MSPAAGTHLGPYQLLSPIGEGGMGTVWLARDQRLDRHVAIKISKEQFTERFEREARAVAALNHPNICQIYDVGPNYIVMEYIEGESPKGPLPLDEVLRISRQLAAALEAAHEKGIVHRDLKPANIKIKPDGTVKVLDFGLAKVGIDAQLTHDSPTFLASATQPGMILGTAAYMSPEQARGKAVDKRADIWAFGVVLYELLTTKPLFAGDTVSDVLAAVLRQEPDLNAVPEKARLLIARCLEKDTGKRLRDIGDYELLLSPESSAPAPPGTAHARRWMAIAAGAAVFAIASLALAAWLWHRPAAIPELTRFEIKAPPGSSIPLGAPAPSPDGRTLAYTVRGADGITRIYLRPLDSIESRVLAGTENAVHPFWSPDGRSLAFAADAELKRVEVAGGSVRKLASTVAPWHGSWGREGTILFLPGGLTSKIAADGGESTPAVKLDEKKQEIGASFPFFLSDGNRFLVAMAHGDGSGSIDLASTGSMERRVVLADVTSAPILAPTPNGRNYLLYLRDSTLMGQEFDEKTATVRGSPFVLLDPVGRVGARLIRPSIGVSPGGVLAYQAKGDAEEFQSAWFDRSGKTSGQILGAAGGLSPNLSPDGRFVAMRKGSGTTSDIWLLDVARGSATRFTFGANGKNYANPVWSPDGKRMVYALMGRGVYVKAVNGTGEEREVLQSDGAQPLAWSPDGRQLLVWQFGKLLLQSLDGGNAQVRVGSVADIRNDGAEISPDGKYVAFATAESGRPEIYVEAMPPGRGRWQVSIDGGVQPRWRKDGRELFFMSGDRKLMAVDIQTSPGFVTGVPHGLFQSSASLNGYGVTPDGQRFLIASAAESAVDAPITVVLNWWAALKK
jgi:Tol biopolymer transport system component/predicted Ser/Thr protein kinase